MILGALIVLCFLGTGVALLSRRARDIALGVSLATLAIAISTLKDFVPGSMQWQETIAWVPGFVSWHVGVDGISYPLVLLTVLVGFVAILVSRREVHSREQAHYALLLATIGATIGVFASLDLILFFVFWEIVLVAMFLLILLWGHANRRYAAMKFLVYTGIGSVALLLAIILIGTGGSFDLLAISGQSIPHSTQAIIAGLLLFAFFIKIPAVPFHTWLPDAHVEAPTAGSVLLAGVLLKLGGYGLIRLGWQLLPIVKELTTMLFVIGTITLLWGAWVTLSQRHLKRLIAYSSVNHMGFVLIGIAAGSVAGAVFEMVSHGLLSAMLFALAGLIHERSGTFDMERLSGLAQRMPRTAWLLVIGALGAMGLPSMSGFVAEFIILMASFSRFGLWTLLPLSGIILGGAYVVRLITKVAFGEPAGKQIDERASVLPFAILLVASLALGILPFLLLGVIGW